MVDTKGSKRHAGRVVFRNCAFRGCGRRFRQRQGVGRPRSYCQVACRRRAQYLRDRATGPGLPGSSTVHPGGVRGRTEKREGRQLLGRTLRNLFWFSGLSDREITLLTRIQPGRVRAILNGEVVPAWPTTFMVVTVMRGSPDDVRWLWEWARGHRFPGPESGDGALHRFQAALRGLRLASEPGLAAPDETAARLLHEEQGLPGILGDWEQTREIVEHFGASAERFQPLWEHARRAALSSPDFFSLHEDREGADVE